MIKIIEQDGINENEQATYKVIVERDGKKIAGFYAYPLNECPEDASLERDLSYAYDAVEFFRLGFEAGKSGEEVIFEGVKVK